MSDVADPLALAEYTPGAAAVLSDAERWPTLTDAGAHCLARWRDHPDAPTWTHATGDRLTIEQIARVRHPLRRERWLDDHLQVARGLLHYRDLPGLDSLTDFPTIDRRDLVRDIAAFVPLDADLSRIVHGTSSGSTGAALSMPDDIEETARGFFMLRALAANAGADLADETADGRMTLANLVHQRQAFTYVSVLSAFGQRATARLNLHPSVWRGAESRVRFLAEADPEILTGDPTSLGALLDSELRAVLHPKALFSGAMALSSPLRAALEDAYGCPVLDVYGLHETRPIAARVDDGPFRVLDRRVHVEVLDADGAATPDGEVGEIVVTAGENPQLPLVRYRTGDFGRLVTLADGGVGIADLEGREHTRFASVDGTLIASVELTQHLQTHGAWGWAVEQAADGAVTARVVGGDMDAVHTTLRALLGQPLEVRALASLDELGDGKPRRYRSAAVK